MPTCCILYSLCSQFQNGVYMRIITTHIFLCQFEQFRFRLLHQLIHIHRFVKSASAHSAGKSNQLSCQMFLCQNLRMIFNMGRRCHLGAQFNDICWSSDILQFILTFQLVCHRHNIHRTLIHAQGLNGMIYFLMTRLIKRFWCQAFTHHRESILIYHQCSEHHPFDIGSLRLQMTVRHIYLLRLTSALLIICCLFWHISILYLFGIAKIRKKNESTPEHLVFLYYQFHT